MARDVLSILWKDLLIEARSKETVLTMFLFGTLVILIFTFAFDADRNTLQRITPGLIWVTFLFFGVLGLSRAFSMEKENDAFHGMMLAPIDRGAIYAGKFLSNLIFVLLVEAFTLPIVALFLGVEIKANIAALSAILVLGTVGFIAVGTLFSAMAVRTRLRELMLPLLLFPVASPVFIAAAQSTQEVMRGNGIDAYGYWMNLMIVYDVVLLTLSFLLFEFVVEE